MRTPWDRLAIVLSVLAILAAFLVGRMVFENLPHLEDEFAYLWQARAMADGNLTLATPPFSRSFLIPFVIDYQGLRFGKYPPGWPAVLSLGVRASLTDWVNPLLAGLAVWLTYRLGKREMDERTAFLAALLLGSSPLFLIQAGSLLSHIWSLVLGLSFFLFWLDSLEEEDSARGLASAAVAGLSLGLLGLTRPLTAAAFSLPFLPSGIQTLLRGGPERRKRVVLAGAIAALLFSLFLVWQKALTGSFTTNPYTLWWPYDRYGFGPGFGVTETGHTLLQGWRNTRYSLRVGASDLFGWLNLSWILLPFGIWAARKSRLSYYALAIAGSLVSFYLAYWVGSWLLGPRYYFEALPGLALLSAAGFTWLAGWGTGEREGKGKQVRALAAGAVLAVLVAANLAYYLPARLGGLHGLYGIERSDLTPFQSPSLEAYLPALVIVDSEHWMPYGSTLVLESPALDSPLIFAWSRGSRVDGELADFYRDDRSILYYYPDQQPGLLYTYPRSGSLIE